MISVFITDDHPAVVEGIRSLLKDEKEIEWKGHALTARACMDFLASETVDVVLMDINLPDGNGIDLCAEIRKKYPRVLVLGLSTLSQTSYISKMMENGASGYVLKNADKEELLEAIQTANRGKVYLSLEAARQLKNRETLEGPRLTRREKEILQLIAEGLTNPEIAEKIFISTSTVDSHRKSIMAKLNAKNTASLVRMALENGLI